MSMYALILAGGSGERFWPLSRKARPKQLLSLFSGKSLLGATLERLEGLVPAENILILTNAEQEAAVREIAPQLPAGNIVAEPAKRDTAAAIALGVAWVGLRDHAATMIVLPADHLIEDRAGFHGTLKVAAAAARQTGSLVTIGIKPEWACPGFGYIEMGAAREIDENKGSLAVHSVTSFREKPDIKLAEHFLTRGNFRWNAGMFVWTIPAILAEMHSQTPALSDFIADVNGEGGLERGLRDKFSSLPKISIDYAIMEKAKHVLMVEANFDWDDVGSWTSVAKYLKHDASENASNTAVATLEAHRNIVYSANNQTVALIGVNDLVVVQAPDALLICRREDAERIKQIIPHVPPELQ